KIFVPYRPTTRHARRGPRLGSLRNRRARPLTLEDLEDRTVLSGTGFNDLAAPLTWLPDSYHSAGANSAATVVLIDQNLADSSLLQQAVTPGAKIFMFDSNHEAATQTLENVISWATARSSSIGSLTILSHGQAGAFELGNQWISTTTLAATG